MKTLYGIFYKSHGKWYGPYDGSLWDTKQIVQEEMRSWKRGDYCVRLKSKCEVRRQNWIKA